MGRERRKRERALPRFPFHCYTNPVYDPDDIILPFDSGLNEE